MTKDKSGGDSGVRLPRFLLTFPAKKSMLTRTSAFEWLWLKLNYELCRLVTRRSGDAVGETAQARKGGERLGVVVMGRDGDGKPPRSRGNKEKGP